MISFGFSKRDQTAGASGDQVHTKVLRQAQQSGVVNLSNRSLSTVPDAVWDLNTPLPPESGETTVDLNRASGDYRWWETQPITRLILTSNHLASISSSGLVKLNTLTQIDLRDNQLTSFPDEVDQLTELRVLNLSANKLRTLPAGLTRLRGLTHLDVSNNQLERLDNDLTDMVNLDHMDLSENKLTSFPDHLPPTIRRLNLGHNRLEQLPVGILDQVPGELPTELGLMDRLQVLLVDCNPLRSIRHNVISGGTEAIKALLRQRHQSEPITSTAAASSTQHQHSDFLPKEQTPQSPLVPNATHETNSDRTSAPPLRTGPTLSQAAGGSSLPSVNSTGILDWSNEPHELATKPIAALPDPDSADAWLAAAMPPYATGVNVRTLQLAHRKLTSFPTGLFAFASTLTSLILEDNKLSELPDQMDSLSRLTTLDLTRNHFRSIPASLGYLPALVILRLDKNPLGPECALNVLTDGPIHKTLENLSLRSCQLTHTPEPSQLSPDRLPNLSHLDLSDNSIGTIPAELGLCTQLKSLQLGGNTFRIPRPAILTKGTCAVLEYLRSRIPS
ncbi:Leucine-rich repeat-containing protein 40 [Fasciola gigantica]|uniref:Leucine-rich repeat-containing protein 40 n=1 Tax=Fasciola gigantica TaxID=46835 RepID=A0A504YQL6_FASGI|nr:Leucine-rich repeat-containing protein 40 [Fasciola gigantica]